MLLVYSGFLQLQERNDASFLLSSVPCGFTACGLFVSAHRASPDKACVCLEMVDVGCPVSVKNWSHDIRLY